MSLWVLSKIAQHKEQVLTTKMVGIQTTRMQSRDEGGLIQHKTTQKNTKISIKANEKIKA